MPLRPGETLPHRGLREFEAEGMAYLVMNELGELDEKSTSVSRGYFRHWLNEEQPPESPIQHILRAAEAILRVRRVDTLSSLCNVRQLPIQRLNRDRPVCPQSCPQFGTNPHTPVRRLETQPKTCPDPVSPRH